MDHRKQAKAAYGELFYQTSSLFFRHDPVGIAFDDNTDEYEPEVGTVLPRLPSCKDAKDVALVLHEEFIRWFEDSAGPRSVYEPIAEELWEIWQEFQRYRPGA